MNGPTSKCVSFGGVSKGGFVPPCLEVFLVPRRWWRMSGLQRDRGRRIMVGGFCGEGEHVVQQKDGGGCGGQVAGKLLGNVGKWGGWALQGRGVVQHRPGRRWKISRLLS